MEALSLKTVKPVTSIEPQAGDGFTPTEIQTTLHPVLHKWQPRYAYKHVNIGDLIPGPGCVKVEGRIINLHEQPFSSKMLHAAKGCLNLILKDDTGAFRVKLHYAKVDYGLHLGQLVSIWMPHISNAGSNSLIMQNESQITSIFPERDNTCYLSVHNDIGQDGLCRTPLGYRNGKLLPGLINLKNYIDGGHEVSAAKVLVCAKSIGSRKTFTTKKGTPCEKTEVHIFDDTAEATFVLWGSSGASAADWKPSHTILLLSHAAFHGDHRPSLSMNKATHVEVDPLISDALWLRGYAERLTRHEHVNQAFPDGIFDVEQAASAENRILFTLADIDELVRASPTEHIIGYLSLAIIELSIFTLYQREKLLCAECCGVPFYANNSTAKCKQCDKETHLRINPRLVGQLVDESGSLASGKLIWSEEAWWQLLGRTKEELVGSSAELLKYLEHRLLFLKIWIMFGWASEVGKLVVLRIGIV